MALTLKNEKPAKGMQYELPLMQPHNRAKLVEVLTAHTTFTHGAWKRRCSESLGGGRGYAQSSEVVKQRRV